MADLELFDEQAAGVTDLVGVTLAERFRLVSIFESASLSSTYRAVDQKSGSDVMVRVVSLTSEHERDDYSKSAQMRSALRHDATARVIASGVEYGHGFVACERIDGTCLADELSSGLSLSPAQTLEIAIPLCAALRESHAAGLLHGRLRPEEVFVIGEYGKGWEPRLTGHRLIEREVADASGTSGLDSYRAPELDEGWALSERTDVFAVGALLFHCLTGQPPPLGSADVRSADEGPSFTDVDPDSRVAPMLEWVAQTAMHPEPSQRFRDMAELGRALDYCADHLDSALVHQLGLKLIDGMFIDPQLATDAALVDSLAASEPRTSAQLTEVVVARRRKAMMVRIGAAVVGFVSMFVLFASFVVLFQSMQEEPVVESSVSVE